MKLLTRNTLILALCVASSAAQPAVTFGDLSLWGIGSQGFVYTNRGSFFGSGTDPWNYREVSLGGEYRAFESLSFTMQGEYRDAGTSDNGKIRLSQAFADLRFWPTDDALVGANLGRVEIPFGLYNRTRDRVDTRPSILLPQSIYFDGLGLRNSLLTGDGAALYGMAHITPSARVEGRAAVVMPVGDISGFEDSPLVSGWIDYLWKDQLRLRFTVAHTEKNERELFFPVLSAQYMHGPWTATAEYSQLQLDTEVVNLETKGWYGQIEYAVTDKLSLWGRYDYLRFDVPLNLPDRVTHGKGPGVGVSIEVTKNLLLNAEYYSVDGGAWLKSQENRGDRVDGFDMFLMMMSLRF